jgi:two-component system chemotaxis response regulator CheB
MTPRIVVVGASAGGIEALVQVVRELPEDLDAALMVVLHMAPAGGAALAKILDRAGPLPAVAATDQAPIEPGKIYACVADHHLLVGDGHLHVRRGPRENGNRPAVDPLFRSAAYYYGEDVIGVVLSGTLSDGTAGLQTIRRRGGIAVVQEPTDALYPGMPASALEYVGADHVVPAAQLGALLADLVQKRPHPPMAPDTMIDDLRREVVLMEHDDGVVEHDHPGTPSPWPCPDCNGVLWQIEDGRLVRFRCRVGHAWAADDLLHVQGTAVESALWMALRALEDRAALTRTLADRARAEHRPLSATRFSKDFEDYDRSVRVLRDLLNRHAPTGETR